MAKLRQVLLTPSSVSSVKENRISDTGGHSHKKAKNVKVHDSVQHEMLLARWVKRRTEVVEKHVE